MQIAGWLDWLLNGLPILGRVWRWIWERKLEIELREPHSQITRRADGMVRYPDSRPLMSVNVGNNPQASIWLDLVLTNHRVDRREVLRSCTLQLKRRNLYLWRQTLGSAPVLVESLSDTSHAKSWGTVILEPLSAATIVCVRASAPISYPVQKLPRHLELWLEFGTVGSVHAHVSRLIETVRHDPNIVKHRN